MHVYIQKKYEMTKKSGQLLSTEWFATCKLHVYWSTKMGLDTFGSFQHFVKLLDSSITAKLKGK